MQHKAGGFMCPECDDILTPSKVAQSAYEQLRADVVYHDLSVYAAQGNLQADRFNTGKPELSYVFDAPLAMEGLANRFALGAKKYSRDNWKKGLPDNELIDALLRHLAEFKKCVNYCEEFDKDGNSLGWQPHVDAIVWNAVVLSEQFHRRNNLGS